MVMAMAMAMAMVIVNSGLPSVKSLITAFLASLRIQSVSSGKFRHDGSTKTRFPCVKLKSLVLDISPSPSPSPPPLLRLSNFSKTSILRDAYLLLLFCSIFNEDFVGGDDDKGSKDGKTNIKDGTKLKVGDGYGDEEDFSIDA